MAAGVALRGSVWLFWISLGFFSCLYWAAGFDDVENGFFDGNTTINDTGLNCPNVTSENCSQLPAQCLDCGLNNENFSCVYGVNVVVECQPLPDILCEVSEMRVLDQD